MAKMAENFGLQSFWTGAESKHETARFPSQDRRADADGGAGGNCHTSGASGSCSAQAGCREKEGSTNHLCKSFVSSWHGLSHLGRRSHESLSDERFNKSWWHA